MPRRPNDPFASFNFLIEIEGVFQGGFQECTGLNSETDAIDYREGTEDITVRKLPGLKKFGNVTLKRGVATGTELFNWRNQVMSGDVQRANVSIVLQNEMHVEVRRWNLREAWPCKYVAPDFKAAANEIAIEQLEVCHEGVIIA